MREILFRGKLKGVGKNWAYGNLNVTIKGSCIITPDETLIGKYGQVDPETVGQYTGLTDKNGKKIFEGDIVRAQDNLITSPFCDGITGKIVYDECAFFIEPTNPMDCQYLYNECAEYEIIGNIHDNPELLKDGVTNA